MWPAKKRAGAGVVYLSPNAAQPYAQQQLTHQQRMEVLREQQTASSVELNHSRVKANHAYEFAEYERGKYLRIERAHRTIDLIIRFGKYAIAISVISFAISFIVGLITQYKIFPPMDTVRPAQTVQQSPTPVQKRGHRK